MSNFSFTKIDVPAAAGTYVYISADGVDAAGEAVGNYGNVDGEGDGTFDGFVTEGSSGITYNPPGSTNTDVVGITSSGEIFGNYVDNVLHQHGFVDNAGVVTKVDVFSANSTTVDGVNDSGVIYGQFADSSNHVHGFVDTNGSYTQIDVAGSASSSVVGINANGQIAGTYTDADFVVHGFVESGGGFTTIDPAGSIFTSIVGIDDAGVVVGNYQDSANNLHGFVDVNGVITTISIAGATSTSIQAINAAGEIVGYYTDGSGNVHGFVGEGGAVATVDVPGATETDVIGVSATGEITGYFNDANGQHGFVAEPATTLIQTDGTTSLTEVGNNYYLDVGGTGPELKYGGTPVTDGEFGAWTPIGAIQVANGYDVAWTLPGGNQYTVWSTDANGNNASFLVSDVPGSNATLESLETIFHQDLNGDGTIGVATTLIQTDGTTSLTEVGSNYYLDASGAGPELKYGGTPVTDGQFGAWTPIGAIKVANGYDVAWTLPGGNQYTVWNTDANGNNASFLVSDVPGSNATLESLETIFHQDLNGDGTIGVATTLIQTDGTTSLTEVGSNYYLDAGGTGPELKYGGASVTAGEFGAWTPVGAIQVANGYDVAFTLPGGNQYTVWNTDANGNEVSFLVSDVPGSNTVLESLETTFHQDLNGDGTIGVTTTLIQTDGTTSLTEVGSSYYLDVGGTGPELKYGGTPVTDGEFGAWTPIGAIQVANGYDVAWTLPGGNQCTVWNTDANGNNVSFLVSDVPGSNATLESLETIFHQDLNGDGVIDTASTVIEANGSIELTLSHMTQAATIDAAAKLELTGADSGSVTFNGATGSLILDHSSGFSGEVFNFNGDGNLSSSDQLDLKDIAFAAGTTVSYTGTSSGGTLTVSDAESHTAHIALSGDYTSSTFSLSSDGSGGTDVIDPVAKQDVADGTLSFGEAASTDQQTVSVTPQNGGAGYLGNFIVDAANAANGQDSVGWHFNFDSSPPAKTITQSYDVAVTDNHADSTHSSATQSVSVTIAGPGNDAFVFHPGVGSETIVNAGNADTIELDGFSSVTNSHQLAQLLSEAQAGQSQSLFTAANGGHDTVIDLGNHDSITLANVHLADLHASNFIIH
jgi:spore maturation protein SpmB